MSRIVPPSIVLAVAALVAAAAGCSGRPLDHGENAPAAGPEAAQLRGSSLAATDAATCAVDGGRVRCWGDGAHGQLGDGTSVPRAMPALVTGLDGIVTLAGSGGGHFCALDGSGDVWCWGANDAGQLGDGSFADRATPVAVAALTGRARAVAAAGRHTCALVQGGTVACWGANDRGQCGGDAGVYGAPTPVGGLDGVRAITSRGDTSCALTRDDRVFCWGDLGGEPTRAPVEIGALAGARALSVGHDAVCALDGSDHDGCIGRNRRLLGSDATYDAAVHVPGLPTPLAALLLGDRHACAGDGGGELRCWGDDDAGQLGDGDGGDGSGPGDGEGADRLARTGLFPSAIAVGARHSCATADNATVYCWGANESGQLGDGSWRSHGHPLPVRRD